MFAIAVSPTDSRVVVLGTGAGTIYRSNDSGVIWAPVAHGLGRGVLALAFNPFTANEVLAGTRADGIWVSRDGGSAWQAQPGTSTSSVRAFAFTRTAAIAGTDEGVLLRSGTDWKNVGPSGVSVDALAVSVLSEPAKIMAGGDAAGDAGLPLRQSADGGRSWTALRNPAAASIVVSALAAGPVANDRLTRPLLMGTNSGGFLSTDGGATWTALGLPATDVTQAAFAAGHADRFYVASDGGGSDHGGLWYSGDAGATFRDLKPPLPEVTALAVSSDPQPVIYTATFRPIDHAVMLWSFRDTGGVPQAPAGGVPAPAHHAVQAPAATGRSNDNGSFSIVPTATEFPYVISGALALFVLFLAMIAYLARGRPRRA